MGSNDLHRFWECEMDVGHAVNIQRIHAASCMRHSSCYDKLSLTRRACDRKIQIWHIAIFSAVPSDVEYVYVFIYVHIQDVTHPEPDPVTVHTVYPPDPECDGVCTPPPRTVCAPGWRSPQNRGFRKNPKNPVFGGQTGYLNNR